MNHDNSNYLKNLLESITDDRKIVLTIFLIQNDKNLLKQIGFSKNDNNLINLEFKNFFLEEYENYLDYIKDQEKSIPETFLNK